VAAGALEDELEVGKGVAGADAGRRWRGNGRYQGGLTGGGETANIRGLAGGGESSRRPWSVGLVVGDEIGTQFIFSFLVKVSYFFKGPDMWDLVPVSK
jgi:hypothetical protein